MRAVTQVDEFTVRRECPGGDVACPRDVGQRTALTWIVKAPAAGKPDGVRVRIGGTTIESWSGGVEDWMPSVMPARLLTNPQWRFKIRNRVSDPDTPQTNREYVNPCDPGGSDSCGVVVPPDDMPDNPPRAMWFWTAPGTYDVEITALHKEQDNSFTDLCTVKRTYAVAAPNRDDPDRQAVDYYVNGGFRADRTDNMDPALHIRWHDTRDKQPYFMGEDWLAFHRMMVKSFDDWRATFGYPPVTPYDGSTAVPVSDGGFTMIDVTRPETSGGTFQPNCYGNGTGCAPEPWFTAAGDGTARGDDLGGAKRCYYAPDRNGVVEEVPTGQRTLADFKDARGLGCVLNASHHRLMHDSVSGAFHFIKTTPRDPLFWAYHKWASGYGPSEVPLFRAAAPAPASVLSTWEALKAQGPPGITAVFPPKGIGLAGVAGIQVLFWEPVTGVQAADLTLGGVPATTVVGGGAEYVFSGFDVPSPPPAGTTITLAIELASGSIKDADGNPFPGDGWQYLLEHDTDGDGVPDDVDNCPDDANPDQRNTDTLTGAIFSEHGSQGYGDGLGDDLGDACDPDDDGDGIPDLVEIANGTDPLDWRDPYPCPLDPDKQTSGPGVCGGGVRDVDQGNGQIACFFSTSTCTAPGQPCDDGDPCTSDACVEPQGCVGTALPSYDGLACRVGQLAGASCGADPVQKKLAKLLAKQGKVGAKLAMSAGHAKKDAKRKKLLHKVDLLLGGVMRKIDAAANKGKITAACGTTLDGVVAAARALLPPLLQ